MFYVGKTTAKISFYTDKIRSGSCFINKLKCGVKPALTLEYLFASLIVLVKIQRCLIVNERLYC